MTKRPTTNPQEDRPAPRWRTANNVRAALAALSLALNLYRAFRDHLL